MRRIRNYAIIYLCAAIGPLAGNAITAMLQPLKTSLNADIIDISLSIPAFMIPFALLQLFSGAISDKWGRKNTVIAGLLIYGLSSLGIMFVTSLAPFLLLRIAQGIGNAFIAPVAIAMLGDITDKSRYGVAMGFYGSFTTAGIFLGPLIGGFAADIDWRIAFALFAALAFFSFILVLALLSYEGMNQRKAGESISRNMREALANRTLVKTSVIGAVTAFSSIGMYFFLADYVGVQYGFQPAEVGLLASMSGLVGMFMSPVAGRLTDRCSPRLSCLLGLSLMIPPFLANAIASELYQFIILSALVGVGTSFFWTGLLSAAVGEIPRLRGTSSSLFNSARFTGFAFSTILLGFVYTGFGITTVIVLAGILMAACLLLISTIPKKPCK